MIGERAGERRPALTALALAGPLILLVLLCARVDARSSTSAHAHLFLAQELVLVLGAAALAAAAAWSRLRVGRDAVTLAAAVLVAFELASAAGAADPWLAVRSATLWISGLVVFLVARAIGRDARDLALVAMLVPLAVAAGSVLLEALGVVRLSALRHAPGGLLGERNVAAELLVAGAPVVAHAALADGPAWRRRAALVVATLSTTAVVLTRTRSAWLAGLALLAVLALVLFRARDGANEGGRRARRVGIAVAFGLALALVLPTTLRWRSAHPYRDSLAQLVDPSTASGGGRLVQYATTWRMAAAHPGLGVGPGNWAGHYLSFARRGDPTVHEGLSPVNRLPNSDLLGFAAERGLVAALVLAALGALLVRQGGPSRAHRGLRRATLLAALVMASLDAVLQTPAALFLVAWVVGLSSTAARAEVEASRSGERSLPRLVFAFAAVALVTAAVPAARRVASLHVASRARDTGDFDRAARLDPGDIALRLVAAEGWIAEGRCDRARAHLDAVTRFSPASPARAELEARCTSLSAR